MFMFWAHIFNTHNIVQPNFSFCMFVRSKLVVVEVHYVLLLVVFAFAKQKILKERSYEAILLQLVARTKYL